MKIYNTIVAQMNGGAKIGTLVCIMALCSVSGATAQGTSEQRGDGLRVQALSSNAQVEQASFGAASSATHSAATFSAATFSAAKSATKGEAVTPLTLPFFDDFSYQGPYPDANKWQDRSVFINNTYPFYPPTYGVATFDAIDQNGALYRQGGTGGVSFSADTLTSLPIRLDSAFTPYPRALDFTDSIILSFYYQPGGGWGRLWDSTSRGQSPKTSDYLILEFYNEEMAMWVKMWDTVGVPMSEFCPGIDTLNQYKVEEMNFFRYVEVPIKVPGFNKRNFQFRFRAYSSVDRDLRTGGGQWHIDGVYLNYGRVKGQRPFTDVAFVSATPTLTQNYTQVPWRHFNSSMWQNQFDFQLTNLGEVPVRVGYQYVLREPEGEMLNVYPQDTVAQTAIIYPFYQRGYVTEPTLSPVPFVADKAEWAELEMPAVSISHIVQYLGPTGNTNTTPLPDFNPQNDTLVFTQTFGDEFAYDDASAESGIGLTYADGALAVCFELKQPDTLSALRLFFNRSYNDVNAALFSIGVWRAVPGGRGEGYEPDALLYESDYISPVLEEGINQFQTYNLSRDGQVLILPQGRFFVGIRQKTATFPNLGFDQNNDARSQSFYLYADAQTHEWTWKPLLFHGALMMRPVLGLSGRAPLQLGRQNEVVRDFTTPSALNVYPNPVQGDVIHIALPQNWSENDTYMQLTTADGRMCFNQKPYSATCSVKGLSRGLYILRLYQSDKVGGAEESVQAKIVIP